jgi:hypothetical protein
MNELSIAGTDPAGPKGSSVKIIFPSPVLRRWEAPGITSFAFTHF